MVRITLFQLKKKNSWIYSIGRYKSFDWMLQIFQRNSKTFIFSYISLRSKNKCCVRIYVPYIVRWMFWTYIHFMIFFIISNPFRLCFSICQRWLVFIPLNSSINQIPKSINVHFYYSYWHEFIQSHFIYSCVDKNWKRQSKSWWLIHIESM